MSSNLFLIELMFRRAKANLFKLLQLKDFNTLLPSVTFWLLSSTGKPVLFLSHFQVKILNNSLTKLLLSTLELLLLK